MLLAVAFSKTADIPSGPLALSVSRLMIRLKTSSADTKMSSNWDRPAVWCVSSSRDYSIIEFQQLAKKVFRISAFCLLSEIIWLSQ